jgi:ATP-dependent exoDNAse (exonuclease V) alpha subunit
LPKIRFRGFADIKVMPGNELIEALEDSYHRVGLDDTVVITRSNKRANIYNNGIRARVVDHEDELCSGDRIMVVKNHYFDDKKDNGAAQTAVPDDVQSEKGLTFIANGDIAVVRRVRNVRDLYGFRFADLLLRFPDYDDYEMQLTAMLDVLQTEASALTADRQKALFDAVMEDYDHLPHKADRLKAVREDSYYNALQIKFAYAATCHKAQGGQWAHIYLDQGYMTDDMLTSDYFHWLYTALTRATEKVFLVNWPKTQVE